MVLATRSDRVRLAESIASYDARPDEYTTRFARLDTSEYIDTFVKALPSSSLPRVLDLGCGSGRDTEALSRRGLQTIGLDISVPMLQRARQAEPVGTFVAGDALSLPIPPSSLDGVWAMASLVHLDTAQTLAALEEVARVLRPSGAAFISVPWGAESEWRPDGGTGRRWFRYFRSTAEVAELLEMAGLTVQWIEDRDGIAAGRWINALSMRPEH